MGRLRGRLHKDEAVLAREHLALVGADLSSGVQVALIADQHDRHIRVAILLDFFKPSCQMGEGVPSRDVVYEECASRPPVIRPRDTLETFLPCSVPNL